MADRPSVSTQVLVGPSSSTQWVSSRSHVSTCGSFICKQANPPSVARTHHGAPLTLRLPHGEQLSPRMCSLECTRRALRAGVVCATTCVCTHAGVLTALGRKREGGTGDSQSEAKRPGRHGWRAWWECLPASTLRSERELSHVCARRSLAAGGQYALAGLGSPHSEGPAMLASPKAQHGAQPVLEQDSGMGHTCRPQDPPCCVATDRGALGGLG